MKRLYNGIITLLVSVTIVLLACSCGSTSAETVVDYGDAEAFEAALNRGENLENKTLLFTVTELHPDSALGFNVCGGNHLNFISGRNPDLKVGDTAGVKAKEISSLLGSWIIKYELIDNPVIGESTIVSDGQNSSLPAETEITDMEPDSADAEAETAVAEAETAVAETETAVAETETEDAETDIVETVPETGTGVESSSENSSEQSALEVVDSNIVIFDDYSGSPTVSAFVAFKNNTDSCIGISSARMDYQDNDGKLLATDQYANCIPEVVKPGQIIYLYSYHFDVSDVDPSNGFNYVPDGDLYEVDHYFEIELSDVSFKTDDIMDISIIGRGTNNTEKDLYGDPGAVFFDSENNVVGFCYGMESFEAGKTKSFEISGDMMSDEYDPSIVDHVEVFIQGESYY